jgi:hypothetical protein
VAPGTVFVNQSIKLVFRQQPGIHLELFLPGVWLAFATRFIMHSTLQFKFHDKAFDLRLEG